MYACMYVCVYIYICMHVCMYVYTYIYICVLITKNDDKPLIWFGGVPNFPRNPDKDRHGIDLVPCQAWRIQRIVLQHVSLQTSGLYQGYQWWWNIMKYDEISWNTQDSGLGLVSNDVLSLSCHSSTPYALVIWVDQGSHGISMGWTG